MGTTSKGIYKSFTVKRKTRKDKNNKQKEYDRHCAVRTKRHESKVISKDIKGRTLTHKDMYNSKSECILLYGGLPKKHCNRSKYIPEIEDKKHRK